jgi:hypothetical protein
MKIKFSPVCDRQRGFLMMDLTMALAILTIAILPLGYVFAHERTELRAQYFRSVANEIVDGEMEILAAGAARDLPDGTHDYSFHSPAAAALPSGHFELTKSGHTLRLTWASEGKNGIGSVTRETTLP